MSKKIELRGRRAILLISTLIFSVLLLMGVIATLNLSGRALTEAGKSEDLEAAVAAVEAGTDYARTRLQERPAWKGDGDGVTTSLQTVDLPDLQVYEDNGDVVGFVIGEHGLNSQFRIRFNYHDGNTTSAGDADGLNDPQLLTVGGPWIAVNNLNSSSASPVPRAQLSSGTWRVDSSSPMPYDVPAFTACVIVEGIAGDGLREQLKAGLNPEPASGLGAVTRRVGESYFRREAAAAADAVSYSAGNLDVRLTSGGVFKVDSADSSKKSKLRSNNNVLVSALSGGAANYQDPNGSEVYVKTSSGVFKVNGIDSTSPAATQRTTAQGEFLEVKWSEIKKASSTGPSIRAGTYVWREPAGGGAPYMEYYAADYNPVSGVYPPGTGTVITSPSQMLLSGASAVSVDQTNLTVEFRDDVYVEPQGATSSLAIIPESAITLSGRRPVSRFVASGNKSPVLTAQGDISFEGRLTGTGSITSAGSLSFQGSSVMESGDNDVALYARKDINLKAIPDPVVVSLGGATSGSSGSTGCSGTCTGGSGSSGCSGTCTTSGSGSSSGSSSSSSSSSGSSSGSTSGPIVTFPGPGGFQDQQFKGVLFAMGDIKADLTGPTYQGNLTIQGIVAAYGGDPDAGDAPGTSGGGSINIKANNAALVYDPAYLEKLFNLNSPAPLKKTFSSMQ